MATLILEQDEHVVAIENNAVQTSGDMNQGCVDVDIASRNDSLTFTLWQSRRNSEGRQICSISSSETVSRLIALPAISE